MESKHGTVKGQKSESKTASKKRRSIHCELTGRDFEAHSTGCNLTGNVLYYYNYFFIFVYICFIVISFEYFFYLFIFDKK